MYNNEVVPPGNTIIGEGSGLKGLYYKGVFKGDLAMSCLARAVAKMITNLGLS